MKLWLQRHLSRLKQEMRFYELLLLEPRTPRVAKWMLGFAIAYLIMPFDIVPDFIPVVGQIDDLVIIPILIIVAVRMIQKNVVNDCRSRAVQSA